MMRPDATLHIIGVEESIDLNIDELAKIKKALTDKTTELISIVRNDQSTILVPKTAIQYIELH